MFKYLRKRSTRSFTDALYFLNFICVQIWTLLSLLVLVFSSYLGIAGTPLATVLKVLLVACWTELGTHTGIIVHKARLENQNKFQNVILDEEPTMDLATKVDMISNEVSYDYGDDICG